ncbi:MAG: hypothetical protein N7Q72_02485, partial [Spiroplasma sp. Tabriz.8]|nr:hypothetical protein [Spiroplasma sp. Tabriz.8]
NNLNLEIILFSEKEKLIMQLICYWTFWIKSKKKIALIWKLIYIYIYIYISNMKYIINIIKRTVE